MAGTSLLYILLLRATLLGVLSGASAMFAAVPVLAVQPKFRHRPRPVSRPNLRRSWRMHHLVVARGNLQRGAERLESPAGLVLGDAPRRVGKRGSSPRVKSRGHLQDL